MVSSVKDELLPALLRSLNDNLLLVSRGGTSHVVHSLPEVLTIISFWLSFKQLFWLDEMRNVFHVSSIALTLTWDIRQIEHRRQHLPLHHWPLCSDSLPHPQLPGTIRQVKPAIRLAFDTICVFKDTLYKDTLYKEYLCKDTLYKDTLYEDTLYKDTLYNDTLYNDTLYEDTLYKNTCTL